MRKFFMIISIISYFSSVAQKKDTAFAGSDLKRATVYYGYGAELEHLSKLKLTGGMQHVLIDGLATQADPSSIQISMPENITVMSFYYRVYHKPVVTKPMKPGKEVDSIKLMQKQLAANYNEQQITEELLRRTSALIENNFTTPDKKNISSEELIRLTNFYNSKVKELKERIFQLALKRDEINEQITAINERLGQHAIALNPPDPANPTGQLILQVLTTTPGTAEIGITYYTKNAGWVPAYDIRLKTIDNSLKLSYRASVTQSTGIEWNAVKMILSTSNPNQGNLLPLLNPLFLKLYVPSIMPHYDKETELKAPVMNEVVVTAMNGKKTAATQYSIGQVRADEINDVSKHTTLKESQLNINFEIDLPYIIPSDNQAYIVNIRDEKLNASYRHKAIPVMDPNAFLVAALNRWDSLGLLPGDATIIMDNVYLGKSFIDPN